MKKISSQSFEWGMALKFWTQFQIIVSFNSFNSMKFINRNLYPFWGPAERHRLSKSYSTVTSIYIMVEAASECTYDGGGGGGGGGGGFKTYARLHWKSNNFLSKNIPSVTSTASRSES